MKVIEPSVEIYREPDHFRKIETIARVCTGTQDKVGSDPDFLRNLLELGHGTPFEHVRVKAGVHELPVPNPEERLLAVFFGNGKLDTYGMNYRITGRTEKVLNPETGRRRKEYFRTLNGRDYLAMGGKLHHLKDLPEDENYMTVKFTVDLGIERELLRHRQMSFMERSTRYARWDDDVEFVRPLPFEWAKSIKTIDQFLSIGDIYDNWLYACKESETQYHWLLHDLECSPQEARTCLNLSAATVLYVTGMYHQWADVLNLRLAKGAHPSMRYIMRKLIELPDFPSEILGMVDAEVLENAKSE